MMSLWKSIQYQKKSLSLANSDIVMARSAIANNRVKLVDDGAWIVLESGRVSASAVKLFPKETCSCPTTRTCYHMSFNGRITSLFIRKNKSSRNAT